MNYRFVKFWYLSHFKRNNNIMCKQIAMRWLFCNKVSSVNNSRPAREEVTGTRKKGVTEILEKMKKRKREVKVPLKREALIIFHGPD